MECPSMRFSISESNGFKANEIISVIRGIGVIASTPNYTIRDGYAAPLLLVARTLVVCQSLNLCNREIQVLYIQQVNDG